MLFLLILMGMGKESKLIRYHLSVLIMVSFLCVTDVVKRSDQEIIIIIIMYKLYRRCASASSNLRHSWWRKKQHLSDMLKLL